MKTVVQVDPNAINNIITNAKVRQGVYATIVLSGVIIGAVSVAYGSAAPEWVDVATRVYLFLAALSGGLALTNTPSEKNQDEVVVDEDLDDSGDYRI